VDAGLTIADGRECRLKRSSAGVVPNATAAGTSYTCSFEVEGDGVPDETISLILEYEPTKKRFWFNKDKGAKVHVSIQDEEQEGNKTFAEFLNQRQESILIGLEGGEIVYQGRNFYRIDYSYAEQALLSLIKKGPGRLRCETEKGSKEQIRELKRSGAARFPTASIFRAIADRRIDFPFDDDVLICDDLGTECADFVAASFKNHQLALIHAKAGSGRMISASSFHDVVAQAMKNLVYLTRSSDVPAGIASWRSTARWNGTAVPRLCRLPRDVPAGIGLWRKLRSDIVDSSNPELYVTLVTAGCCDIDELNAAVADPTKRTPEIAQLLHLLDGLNGYTRQLGVRRVVYDVAYQR
jgi:hypothetical protein